MGDATAQTLYFYDRHPISCDIILAKLRKSRGHINDLRPDDLFPHDQDHYGGLAATDELARGGQITSGTRVADFCAGLGGTVRYLAHKHGANVTGIELTPSRVRTMLRATLLIQGFIPNAAPRAPRARGTEPCPAGRPDARRSQRGQASLALGQSASPRPRSLHPVHAHSGEDHPSSAKGPQTNRSRIEPARAGRVGQQVQNGDPSGGSRSAPDRASARVA